MTPPGVNRDRVLATFDKHPLWTSPQIAKHLGLGAPYVRTTLKRNGRKLTRKRYYPMPGKLKTCPCCGQVIAPRIARLVGLKHRLYEAVRRHPRTADELRNVLWSGTQDGGPRDAGTLYTLVWQVNQIIKTKGIAIRTSSYGKHSQHEPYRVVAL